jgi:phosphocarrier protein HPr
MIEKIATIQNTQGIHCRPSAMIVRFAANYAGGITVRGERGVTALRSIMELMALELFPGTKVTIQVSGPDEESVCEDLASLFETHFDFPPLV